MEKLAQATNRALANPKELQRQLRNPTGSLGSSPESKKQTAEMVTQCFEVLNTYGKEPEQLASINKMFQTALAEYDPKDIKRAFVEHIQNNSVMPTPADIIGRIKGYIKHRKEMNRYQGVKRPKGKGKLPRPAWIGKTIEQMDSPTLHEFQQFLKSIPEAVGRTYCGQTWNYDRIVG